NADIPNRLFGLLAPMKNNMLGARNVAAAFQGAAQLPPASNGYGAPQLQQPQYGAPVPMQNAPGYASVPPPPVAAPQGPYGAVQQPQSFAPPSPPGNGYGRNQWS